EKRTHYLSMAANVAVLIGLLGTVRGIIQAFAAVANVDPAVRAEMLSRGIALALNATFLGLTIAIPSLLVYSFLQSKATKLIDEIDEYSLKAFHLLRPRREVAQALLMDILDAPNLRAGGYEPAAPLLSNEDDMGVMIPPSRLRRSSRRHWNEPHLNIT